jgi:uncharacterized membrane protein YuzA (DUF378 family)
MRASNTIDWIAISLVIIGALNWGMVGLFDFNLVDALFGAGSAISRTIYALVGLSGLYALYLAFASREERSHGHAHGF